MQHVDPEGVCLYYERSGTGPMNLVLLHGLGASAETWRDVQPLLEPHAGLLLVDLKGAGRSAKPNDGRYAPEDHGTQIAGLVRGLGLDNIVLAGNSYGGTVLPYAAMHLQDRLRGVIYIDPAVYPQPVPLPVRVMALPVLPRLFAWAVPARLAVHIVLRDAFFDRSLITPERVDRHVRFQKLPGGIRALHETARLMLSAQDGRVAAKAREVRAPLLVIWGEHDRVTPTANAGFFERDFPKARIRIIRRCGHAPQEECPGETAGHIQSFLTDLVNGSL